MNIFGRFGLFIITNIAILVVLSVVLFVLDRVFGIQFFTTSNSNLGGLLFFSAIVGFLGSFISLFISRFIAKKSYGITPIQESEIGALNKKEKLVWDTVMDLANRNGIKMPEVGIYEAKDPNAFATGATKNSALVAVSTGLLDLMSEDEIEAVVGHEMAHILNGDMVTMTLVQGVMNTFVIFFSRIIANIFDQVTDGKFGILGYFAVNIILQIIFGILASIIVNWFSRYREFRADEGAAKFIGKEKMIQALEALKRVTHIEESDAKFATMQINTNTGYGIKALFMTHPPLEKRIENLQNYRY